MPENLAMGVSLIEGPAAALLVAIFVSNLPEAIVGARKMREAELDAGRIMAIWLGAAVLLAVAVVVGYGALEGVDDGAARLPVLVPDLGGLSGRRRGAQAPDGTAAMWACQAELSPLCM